MKIKLKINEYYKMTIEESKNFFGNDADNLQDIENGMIGVLFTHDGKLIQSQVIEKDSNVANIEVWNEDLINDCDEIIEIVSFKIGDMVNLKYDRIRTFQDNVQTEDQKVRIDKIYYDENKCIVNNNGWPFVTSLDSLI